jgi:protein O-GlcNAc transferase
MTPQSNQSIFEQATKLHARGQFAEVEKLYRQVLQKEPARADAMHWIGLAASQTNRLAEARDWIQKAIAIDPRVAEYHYNLGIVFTGLGRLEEAIKAFENAIKLRPDFADAWTSIATAQRRLERYDEAIQSVQTALKHQPNLVKAHNNLASYYRAIGKLDEALSCYDRALQIDPENAPVASNRLFLLHFHRKFDSGMILKECQAWNERFANPLAKEIRPHSNDRNPDRPLRVGFLSPDFRNHCQAFFMLPLLENLDRKQCEIYCYSDVKDPDEVTQRLQKASSVWRNIVGMTDQAVAEGIRADGIDILIDLTMHMAGGRPLVFARKPAPVQATWLAYPGTTGLSAMDYRISDRYLDEDQSADAYSEKTIRLPNTFWCYDPLAVGLGMGDLPALRSGHITFGCLNNFCKVNTQTLQLWGRVLKETPGSRFIMLVPPGRHRAEIAGILGIDSARLRFVHQQSRGDYLTTHRQIDIALDTLPYNGHTTSLDSYWMGVPVVTMVGNTIVGRAGWSQLNNLNMTELAAFNEADFVRIAKSLAADLPALAQLRRDLRGRMEKSPLMDAPRFANQMMGAFRTIWREYCTR